MCVCLYVRITEDEFASAAATMALQKGAAQLQLTAALDAAAAADAWVRPIRVR